MKMENIREPTMMPQLEFLWKSMSITFSRLMAIHMKGRIIKAEAR